MRPNARNIPAPGSTVALARCGRRARPRRSSLGMLAVIAGTPIAGEHAGGRLTANQS
jgi:hypothetical protein